jgi:hypothetical protein
MPAADTEKREHVAKRARDQKMRNLERALKEERLGLTAIATAFVQTHGDADAMAAKMEAMVRSAVEDPRVKPGVKKALIAGQQIVQRALAIHLGQPQPLFTDGDVPDTGHVNPSEAKALANPPEAQQVGLFGGSDGLEDALAAHDDRESLNRKIADHIVRLFRENGPMTDWELLGKYEVSEPPIVLARWDLYAHRVDLTRNGRIVDTGERRRGGGRTGPVWDLLERTALT